MDYVVFNFLEGLFWTLLGISTLYASRKVTETYKTLSLFFSCILIAFGLSDFAECFFGSFFEPGMLWLFIWKSICVLGLLVGVFRYILLRIFRHKKIL